MNYVQQLVPEARMRIRQEHIRLNALLDEDCLDIGEAAFAYVDNVGHYRINSAAVLQHPREVYQELVRIAHRHLSPQEVWHAVASAHRYLRTALACSS